MAATARDAASKSEALREKIRYHEHRYFVLDDPEISDADFDRLVKELRALEAEHPELVTPDSPTQRVGGKPSEGFPKVRHSRPMLSLDNAYSDEELLDWERRVHQLSGRADVDYACELKLDGMSMALWYRDGKLARGITRGDGSVGEDVTTNVRTIRSVPLSVSPEARKKAGLPRDFEVRGEVIMPLAAFQRMNEEREQQGLAKFANPRNAAAGALRQLDPKITRARGLRVFTFQVEAPGQKLGIDSQHELLEALPEWGLPVEPHHQRVSGLDSAHQEIAKLEKLLPTLDYGADGVAVKVDRRSLYAELGIVGNREPRWAIARKFAPEVQVTKLLEIRINVGRTGALNPYAVLEPVEVGGVTVSNATLHNADLIATKDIRVGDWVEVTRAGEVIPQILGPLRDRRSGAVKPFRMPEKCPSCGSQVEHPQEEVMTYCPNISCPSRILEGIVHFASRSAMDVRGLGYERVRALLDARLITDVADLYDLTSMQLLALEGFAEKSAQQLVESIAASKRQPLSSLLFALGIRHVGAQGARLLARHFGSMKALARASADEVGEVRGVGPAIAEAVAGFFAEPRNRKIIERLEKSGLTMKEAAEATGGGPRPLADQTYVITGTLPTLSRQQAKDLIEAAGGHVSDSLSKKTTALVVGSDPGSKLDKAKSLGVEQIEEAELLRRAKSKP